MLVVRLGHHLTRESTGDALRVGRSDVDPDEDVVRGPGHLRLPAVLPWARMSPRQLTSRGPCVGSGTPGTARVSGVVTFPCACGISICRHRGPEVHRALECRRATVLKATAVISRPPLKMNWKNTGTPRIARPL